MANKDGTKSGGRAKGVRNKDSPPVEEKAKELGIDPWETLLLFVKGDYKALGYSTEKYVSGYSQSGDEIFSFVIEPSVRMKAASEAMNYIAPKKKSVEHTGIGSEALVNSFSQMVASLAKEMQPEKK